eukprot:Sspe_Gene.44437::Locus_21791_Transcript_1_1_Confidence_1.000_Length_9698::g.44437::m.44437
MGDRPMGDFPWAVRLADEGSGGSRAAVAWVEEWTRVLPFPVRVELCSDGGVRGANRGEVLTKAASQLHTPFHYMIESAPPSTVVLHFKDSAVTAGDLVGRARSLAARLPSKGTHVAVSLPKGVEWTVACLGCTIAGTPFTLLDPRLTPQQRRHIWTTWDPKVVVCETREQLEKLVEVGDGVEVLEYAVWKSPPPDMDKYAAPVVTLDDATYVDWTTGTTTGKPKGVVTRHRHLANMLWWRMVNYPMGEGEACGVNLFPLWYWWMAMCMHRPTVLIPDDVLIDPILCMEYIRAHRVTRIDCITPSLLHALIANAPSSCPLRLVVVSGEALRLDTVELASRVLPDTVIVNLLSTTEAGDVAAVEVTMAMVEALNHSGAAPVGIPLPSVEMSIDLHDTLHPYTPSLSTEGLGELVVSGVGVPQGTAYLGDPSQAFREEGGRTVWRTKDAIRIATFDLDPEGFLAPTLRDLPRPQHFLVACGRLDNVTKVRGFKVDLHEIQRALKDLSGPIADTAVVAAGEELVVAVRMAAGAQSIPEQREVVDHLRGKGLADSHLPNRVLFLSTLPLTPTGKISHATLREWVQHGAPRDALLDAPPPPAVATRDAAEAKVLAAWRAVLPPPGPSSVHQSLFEIGGQSLTATRLAALLPGLRVGDIFAHPTIAQQAALIRGDEASEGDELGGGESVAIVGIGVRWPVRGGDTLEAVWKSLSSPDDLTVPLSPEVLAANGVPPDLIAHPSYVSRGVVLDDEYVKEFDWEAWGMSYEEALKTDPNQRCLLEVSYEALVDAGCDVTPTSVGSTAGRNIGVFLAGPSLPQYLTDVLRDDCLAARLREPAGYWQLEVGNDKDYIASRVAFLLNLHGPAETVQSACSSGLLAVATGMEAIRSGRCRMALAGAASIQVPQHTGYLHQEGMVWSSEGRCRPFDSGSASGGTVPGNAAVVFALKRHEDAVADGDRIYGVLKGAGVNNDGSRKPTFNAPSSAGQAEVIRKALRDAKVAAHEVTMVEGHGTGTIIGDPVEIDGLARGYHGASRISLGSVKGHIGHANTAAGAVGLLKAVLCLWKRRLVPTANHTQRNMRTSWPDFLRVQTTDEQWEGEKRVCGVSSFGVGGTNVHVIAEEAPQPTRPEGTESASEGSEGVWRVPVSAFSAVGLAATAQATADMLRAGTVPRPDIGYTMARRPHLPFRGFVGADGEASLPDRRAWREPSVVLCFAGQGGNYTGMGRGLWDAYPAFRSAMAQCADVVHHPPLEAFLRSGGPLGDESNTTRQLSLFCVEFSVAVTLASLGITPSVVFGHSLGEITAATIAGVFSLPDAITVIKARGKVADSMSPGSMMSVVADVEEVRRVVAGLDLEIACINARDKVVLAGPPESLRRLVEETGWSSRMVQTSTAFHTREVDKGLHYLREALEKVDRRPPAVTIVSTVTGAPLSQQDAVSVTYWLRQMRECVQFAAAAEYVAAQSKQTVVFECGPQLVTGCLRQVVGPSVFPTMCKPSSVSDEAPLLRSAVEGAWVYGVRVDWTAAFPHGDLASLPPIAWTRRPCWPEETRRAAVPSPAQPFHPPAVPVLNYASLSSVPVVALGALDKGVWGVASLGGDAPSGVGNLSFTPEDLIYAARMYGRVAVVCEPCADRECAATGLSHLVRVVAVMKEVLAAHPTGLSLIFAYPRLHPVYAPLLGFFRTLAREAPGWSVQRLQYQTLFDVSPILRTCASLPYEELKVSGPADCAEWSYAALLPDPPAPPGAVPHEMHSVLVTGGTKGVGLEVVRAVAARGATRITVLARNPPATDVFDGLPVDVQQLDLADPSQGETLRDLISEGGFDTVFHCAGVVRDAAIHNIQVDDLLPQVGAKMHAAEVIVSAAGEAEVVLMSSTSAVLGPAGQAVYCAANAYMDALAAAAQARGQRVRAVQWGGWSVGMSETFNIQPLDGEHFLTPDVGIPALFSLLSQPPRTSMVLSISSWPRYAARLNHRSAALFARLFPRPPPLIGTALPESNPLTTTYETLWPSTADPFAWGTLGMDWVLHHRMGSVPLVPATLWIQLMSEAAAECAASEVSLQAVRFHSPYEVPPDAQTPPRALRTSVHSTPEEKWEVRVASRTPNGGWKVHATAQAVRRGASCPSTWSGLLRTCSVSADNPAHRSSAVAMYRTLRDNGFDYDIAFRRVVGVTTGPYWAAGVVAGEECGGVTPAVLDACTQLVSLVDEQASIPWGVRSVTVNSSAHHDWYKAIAVRRGDAMDVLVLAPSGEPVAALEGFEARAPFADDLPTMHEVRWVATSVEAGARPPNAASLPWLVPDTETAGLLRQCGVAVVGSVEEVQSALGGVAVVRREEVDEVVEQWSSIAPWWTARSRLWVLGGDVEVRDVPPHLECLLVHAPSVKDIAPLMLSLPSIPSSMCMVRDGAVKCPQLAPCPTPSAISPTPSHRFAVLVSGARGSFSASMVPCEEAVVGPHDVEIAAEAWALNFLDVLLASGVMSKAKMGDVGGECAGRVTRVGKAVTTVKVGDRVAALPKCGLRSLVVCPEHWVARIPDAMSAEEACTVSLAYGTAWLALKWLARVAKGDTVLIHAACGGVGQAALNLVKAAGAVPLCTVSSPEKRAHLVSACGVADHAIFQSRNAMEFTRDVLAATGGQGVDIVLNSLADQAMLKSLQLLRPFGRFVEIGKRDQQGHTAVDLASFRGAQQYMSAHLDLLLDYPDKAAALLGEVWEAAAGGRLPPLPSTRFPINRAAEALEFLSSGKHIGKVVLTIPSAPASPLVSLPPAPPRFESLAAAVPQLTWVESERSLAEVEPKAAVAVPAGSMAGLRAVAQHNGKVVWVGDEPSVVAIDTWARGAAGPRVVASGTGMGRVLPPEKEVGRKDPLEVLVRHVAARLRLTPEEVNPASTLSELGIDSLAQLQLAHVLRTELQVHHVELHDAASLTCIAQSLSRDGVTDGVTVVRGGTKHRVLCLHGFRSSRDLLQSRLHVYAKALQAELIVVDAPHHASGPGDPSVPEGMPLREWWHCPSQARDGVLHFEDGWFGGEYKGYEDSVEYIMEVAQRHGPVSGVLGFSQGGAMATVALSRGVGRWAVLFSAVPPPTPPSFPIPPPPTFHFYDPTEEWADAACSVAKLFSNGSTAHHSHGHVVPTDPASVTAVQDFVNSNCE